MIEKIPNKYYLLNYYIKMQELTKSNNSNIIKPNYFYNLHKETGRIVDIQI
jgi:hypothetical protein